MACFKRSGGCGNNMESSSNTKRLFSFHAPFLSGFSQPCHSCTFCDFSLPSFKPIDTPSPEMSILTSIFSKKRKRSLLSDESSDVENDKLASSNDIHGLQLLNSGTNPVVEWVHSF